MFIIEGFLILVAVTNFAYSDLSGFDPSLGITDQKLFADEINAAQKAWIAGDNFGQPLSMDKLKMYGSTILKKPELPMKKYNLADVGDIPDSFDLRSAFPQCASISSVKDQSNCGSCWAVTSAAAFSDRICVKSKGTKQMNISAESLMDCCSNCGSGCNGGYIDRTWQHFQRRGEVTGGDYNSFDGCQPYSIMPCGGTGEPECEEEEASTPFCKFFCTNRYYPVLYPFDKHRTKNAYYMSPNIQFMQREIMNYGPLVASFVVYADFFTYKSGVYVHSSGRQVGGHATRIIGWGRENGMDYWLAVNSWGPSWGDKGYFKFLRGVNHCQIESYMIGGET